MKAIRPNLKEDPDNQPPDLSLLAVRYKELLELRQQVRMAERTTLLGKGMNGKRQISN